MPPNRRAQRAASAAKDLQSLLQGRAMTQLLQQAPPASTSAEQQRLITQISSALQALATSIPKDSVGAADAQFLSGLLHHQAAHSVGLLLTWAQRRPEQLAAALQRAKVQSNTAAGIWIECIEIISTLVSVYPPTAKSTVAWSQQLEMSGGCASLQDQHGMTRCVMHQASPACYGPMGAPAALLSKVEGISL
jgi:hypothetical protein